ncbi:hypothetical protein N9Z53_03260, partial [Mariniblastus sp.]|nr:hypothetical protein [Mariniblastus sp.]
MKTHDLKIRRLQRIQHVTPSIFPQDHQWNHIKNLHQAISHQAISHQAISHQHSLNLDQCRLKAIKWQ